ncbi:MAG: VWA domain-containing protein [Myxococcales bacterium]|nr:VWA domain-containing protein [Myxococcales bacterium]MCB9582614.1 VWA domain-containing protein [Polyangiaceae bacterium]
MRRWAALAVAIAIAAACSSQRRPPPFQAVEPDSGTGGTLPTIDASGDGPPLCGNTIVPVIIERPNLYFILDRSGSMAEKLPGSAYDKYENARIALGSVMRAIGHRVNVGAALFPGTDSGNGCGVGKQVFPTQQGDPPSYLQQGKDGPVLTALLATLASFAPKGGTPTTDTIKALTPTLTALPGDTNVVLATDGGPNCNLVTSCTADACIPNIEGASIGGVACTPSFNCCDESFIQGAGLNCLDGLAAVAAVTVLANAGIKTYVVGMPGSTPYASVLDALAVAGLTDRPTSPKYYPVTDSDNLTQTLKAIGVKIAVSCTVELGEAPPDPDLVNVYFDTKVVPQSDVDGWVWTDDTTIDIVGPACDELKSGDVVQVQVAAGCPTEIR